MNEQDLFDFQDPPVRERSPHLIPWIVTGIVAVLLLVSSIVVLNIARGSDSTAEPDPTPTPTTTEPTTPPVEPSPEPTEPEEPEDEPAPSSPDDEIDTSFVNVGSTFEMDIQHWNTQVDLSSKFGAVQYSIDGERLILNSSLIDSFPDACQAMRNQWGMERISDNTFEVASPQQVCEENPSLYTEVLGLIQAMVKSARPL